MKKKKPIGGHNSPLQARIKRDPEVAIKAFLDSHADPPGRLSALCLVQFIPDRENIEIYLKLKGEGKSIEEIVEILRRNKLNAESGDKKE
jgi:hypothetical protein